MMRLSRLSILCSVKQHINSSFIRSNTTQTATKSLVHLSQRTLLRLAGEEVSDYLQGLITNDMKHLKEGSASIYSAFLNIRGRVLYDTIVYKAQEDNAFFVECDCSVADSMVKHLKMYKLRRKIDVAAMSNTMKVWSVYDENIVSQDDYTRQEMRLNLEGKIFPCGISDNKSSKLINNILIYSDPRIFELGLRILTQSSVTHNEIIKHLEPSVAEQKDVSNYKAFRYQLGIGEGTQDLPPGTSFPLEINCDYLHGVSFHKGCYIGQELTARTHHTGVVRKRLMPLILSKICDEPLEYDEKIVNENGKMVGKIRGHEGIFGLGLIRISEALASKTLTVRDCALKVVKPQWWPQESQKVEASLKTSKN